MRKKKNPKLQIDPEKKEIINKIWAIRPEYKTQLDLNKFSLLDLELHYQHIKQTIK